MLQELWEAAAPGVMEVIAALLMFVIGWASLTLKTRLGLDIEARHRDALHSAVMSGVQAAMEGNLSGQQAADMAVDYVRQSVPDAIRYLGAPDGVLMGLAKAKLKDLDWGFAK